MCDNNVVILLIEDDDVDAEAVTRAFQKSRISNRIIRARNGIEALDVLRGTNGAMPVMQPYLILLDLNMPQMDGQEFLEELRQDPLLSRNIVFVLTTSNDQQDKLAAYSQNIAGYLVKSKIGADFIKLTSMIDCFWHAIQFPPNQAQLQVERSHRVDAEVFGV